MKTKLILTTGALYLAFLKFVAPIRAQADDVIQVDEGDIGFPIPDLGEFLGFFIRLFFVLAGLLALFYMLWGALSWVTSGGDSENVKKAREKIVAAAVGVLLIVATLAVVVALEQIVFNRQVCFGISCPLSLPKLLQECIATDDNGKCTTVCTEYDNDGNCTRTAPADATVNTGTSSNSNTNTNGDGTGSDSNEDQLPSTGGGFN